MRLLPGIVLMAACVAAPARAQTWRTIDVSRQLRDTAEHHVRVEYGAGRLDLQPTSEPLLYSMQLRYDEENGEAVHSYDADRKSVVVGVHHQSVRFGMHTDDRTRGDMRLVLSRVVPMDLEVDVGAARATLELGGLTLHNLRLESGATDASVRFSRPNPARLRALDIDVGAGSLEAQDLANANASTVRVKGGIGGIDLDFGGTWTQDIQLDVNVAMGKVGIHVPSDVGVQVDVDRFLASFDHEGLTKRNGVWVSDNFDRAPYKLRIHAATVFGGILVDRSTP